MGQITDLRIREFQERAGIEPATGKRAARLADMSKHAHDLIRVLALEQAGIRDGDGYWHGSDPVHGIIGSLVGLEREGSLLYELERDERERMRGSVIPDAGGTSDPHDGVNDDDKPF